MKTFTTACLATFTLASTLKEEADKRGFFIGAAINTIKLEREETPDNQYWGVFRDHFNMGVAENHCKPGYIQKTEGNFDFTDCKNHLNITKANGQKFRGHALVWHNGNAGWFDNATWTGAELAGLLENHVTTVVSELAGDVYAWDVVNEAIDWKGGNQFGLRDTQWSDFDDGGEHENYIHAAFDYASQADPRALLFYNDFNLETNQSKVNGTVAMIQSIQDAGIKIDGVGIQYHVGPQSKWNPGYQPHLPITRETTAAVIKTFGDMGLQVQITEIDVDLCDASLQEPCVATEENLLAQAQMYADAFNACYYDNPGVCTAFVAWGFTDKFTWKTTYDSEGNAYALKPLYFTEDYQTKPAYDAVLDLLTAGQDILPDYLAFSSKTDDLTDKPYCQDCAGDCRWSWPLGDSLRGKSEDATWRCQPTYTYGGKCAGNYEFCEPWCTSCHWTWSNSWDDRWSDDRAACRCDMSQQDLTFKSKIANSKWGLCDGCTDGGVCHYSWPTDDPLRGRSWYAIQRCEPN